MNAVYASYPSTVDPELMLYARFAPASSPAPLLLRMHGWHGNVKAGHTDNVEPTSAGNYNVVQPEMRGRGDSTGLPDANGWELQDAVDALAAHVSHFPDQAETGVPPLLWGGSGGGGNTLGLLGKFPDLFATAVCECGIADYGLWFANDQRGEFRDEMEDAGWIGGTPVSRPEAYLARGGRTTAMNLLTPLFMVHGEADPRVPFEHAECYREAAATHGRDSLIQLLSFPEVGDPNHFSGISEEQQQQRRDSIARHLRSSRAKPELPRRGRFVVAGYLRTEAFSVELESVDHVAILDYDLDDSAFACQAPSSRHAALTIDGKSRRLACEPIELETLCEDLAVPHPASYPIRALR